MADPNTMSGLALPAVFNEKVQEANARNSVGGTSSSLLPSVALSSTSSSNPRIFTVQELEAKLRVTSQAIVNLQKQIVRGEETYYEETQQAHGSNLFRGFDTYIDSRATDSSGERSNHSGSAPRRMPGDYRWFSSSFSNISKYIKGSTSAAATASGSSFPHMNVEVVRLTKQQLQAHEEYKKKQREGNSESKEKSFSAMREKRSLEEVAKANDDGKQEPPQKVSRSGSTGNKGSASGRPTRKRKST